MSERSALEIVIDNRDALIGQLVAKIEERDDLLRRRVGRCCPQHVLGAEFRCSLCEESLALLPVQRR